MQGTRLKEKVNIFISSNCGGRYTLVREALRLLLLETGMCEVYMFEEEGATTSDVVSSYMRRLERSDIIVFLIDNKDGIGEGTMKEVKRGRELKKKSLFLFCDENEKEATELQKEIIGMPNGEKFKVISQFAKFPEIAYESVINDIIDTYLSYCNAKVARIEAETDSANPVENTVGDIRTILNKDAFKGCNYTKWLLNSEVIIGRDYPKKIDTFDRLCGELLEVILGNKAVEDIDFDGIKKYVKDMHEPGNLQKAIIYRLDAMESYWNCEINKAISYLVKALNIALGTKKIPRWFINDIAIDLRNMNVIINQERNVIEYSPQGQDVINESDEPVFFPVVDRFSSNFYENVAKGMLENAIESPFTIRFGGVDYILDQIVDIYVAALLYGSIVHTSMIREKTVSYLQGLCLQYRDHKILVTTIKLLLIVGDEKKLSKFIEAYGICTDNVTSEDVSDWIEAVSRIKIKYRRINSLCLLFGFWGSYFSDKQFEDMATNLKSEILTWADEQYAGDLISKVYLSALERNQYRISQSDVLEVAYCFKEKKLRRWYDNIFGLLSRIRLDKIGTTEINRYMSWLIGCINDDEIRKQCHKLPAAVQNVRLQREDVSLLDEVVKEKYEHFYNKEYSLNVFEHDLEETNIHIDRLIECIESQNETQGKGGCYSEYVTNPYRTIENILTMGKVKVRVNEIEKILRAAIGTLMAERQTLSSKMDAWKLITIIFMRYPNAKCVKVANEDINQNIDVFLQGKDVLLVAGYNESSLQIAFQFWKMFTNQNCELEVIEAFSNIAKNDDAKIITILGYLYSLLTECEKLGLSIKNSKYMLQSLLEFSRNENSEVRFYAYISLIKLININEECEKLILKRLSEAMDNEVYKNKVAIVSRVSNKKGKQIEYIISKGKVDNHFWVRNVANR